MVQFGLEFQVPYVVLKFVFLMESLFYLQSNPIARWHICQGSINSLAFSSDGAYLATVGRDGIFLICTSCYFIDECHCNQGADIKG